MDFTVKVSKVGGEQLGIYLPKWQCENLDIRHGDRMEFVSDKSGGFLTRVYRKVRPKSAAELLPYVEEIANHAASEYYRCLGITPIMTEEEISNTIAANEPDAYEKMLDALASFGVPIVRLVNEESGNLARVDCAEVAHPLLNHLSKQLKKAVGRDVPTMVV